MKKRDEAVRDRDDNCIIVCSIENLDAMGVHTGDSITVAPSQTLTDKEYQRLRNASIAVLRRIGVDTGGSNVQFALNPDDGRLLVIEMNPRVSRSSALASRPPVSIARGGRSPSAIPRRTAQRDHWRRRAGRLRTPHRLHADEDSAFRLREVPARHPRLTTDEIGGRGHGHGPQSNRCRAAGLKPASTGWMKCRSGGRGAEALLVHELQ